MSARVQVKAWKAWLGGGKEGVVGKSDWSSLPVSTTGILGVSRQLGVMG
jgi:hypothetical protein